MDTTEVELTLLQDYLSAALKADNPAAASHELARFEKQVALCKSQGLEFNLPWCEAMAYYVKANIKLNTEGMLEKTLRESAKQSTGFDGVATAMMASNRESGRVREAIALLDKAISIYDDDVDFWFFRASCYAAIGDKQSALRDVNHVLENHGGDQEVYLAARKLKDDIETTKKDCFIATAVYENPDSMELILLRSFRDEVLLSSVPGRAFVRFYYAVSPKLARLLRKSPKSKSAIRCMLLDPIVAWLRKHERSC